MKNDFPVAAEHMIDDGIFLCLQAEYFPLVSGKRSDNIILSCGIGSEILGNLGIGFKIHDSDDKLNNV